MPSPSQVLQEVSSRPPEPESDELLQTLIARAQEQVRRKLMPPAAGDASPSTMRAAQALREAFPADMAGVKVIDMPWDSPSAFSNVLGSTPTKIPPDIAKGRPQLQGDTESIEINPGSSILEPQGALNAIMAHELEHIRQNRNDDPWTMWDEREMKYEERPSELAAQLAAREYTKAHGDDNDVRQTRDYPLGANMVLQELARLGPLGRKK